MFHLSSFSKNPWLHHLVPTKLCLPRFIYHFVYWRWDKSMNIRWWDCVHDITCVRFYSCQMANEAWAYMTTIFYGKYCGHTYSATYSSMQYSVEPYTRGIISASICPQTWNSRKIYFKNIIFFNIVQSSWNIFLEITLVF